jgi:ribosome-interacting GTPase 1
MLFSENPKLPNLWNLCHLWCAQTIISSVIVSNEKYYKSIKRKKYIINKILKESEVYYSGRKDVEYFIISRRFKDYIMKGLKEYILSEIDHIKIYCTKHGNLSPKPKQKTILQALKTDINFKTR